MQTSPFKRAQQLMAAINAALAGGMNINLLATLPQFVYESRGKGKARHPGKRFIKKSGRYMPHQGKGEVARRASQIERGILQASADAHWFSA